MKRWYYDLQLLLRSNVAVGSLVLLLVLTTASLLSGVQRIDSQREAIARIGALHAEDTAAVVAAHGDSVDAGTAAYYSFQPTWNPPSPLAFAAVGMRDVAPIMLRVRALGLEAQIHDGDTFNPELALAGRFDFSFLLTFLLPLFAIALLHDLRSSETESGRERMLRSLPLGTRWLYLRRTTIRGLALWLCVSTPFVVVAINQGVPMGQILAVLALAAAYLLFWVALCLLISRRAWNSGVNAAVLASCWVVLALIAPALANVGIERAIPVEQGATIARAQRETVNGAWDIPRDRTMQQFYASHPQWRDSAPLGDAFHYKWYLAFHQNGDDQVAPLVAAYREGIERRNAAAAAVGWVLPSVGLQVALTRMAGTDMKAHLAYQDRIRGYHERLRQFFYGYLFTDKPFVKSDYDRIPPFESGE